MLKALEKNVQKAGVPVGAERELVLAIIALPEGVLLANDADPVEVRQEIAIQEILQAANVILYIGTRKW